MALRGIHTRRVHNHRNITPADLLPSEEQDVPSTDASLNPRKDSNSLLKWLEPNIQHLPHRSKAIAEEAVKKLLGLGYDPDSLWEQEIVWGDHDSFQHVNNVRYVRFFESGRLKWMSSLGHELGGHTKASAMLKGKGVSLILKSLSMDYKAPVTYPDTLLIAHQPHRDVSEALKNKAKTHLPVRAVAYSYAQKRIVTASDSVLVWYDYEKLRPCDPGEEMWAVLEKRIAHGSKSSDTS
ncbi:hypothetical protein EUX98_g3685 [Antrodiella citrinella]|uniref:Thioesterase domain-containing protein n=1 Tax=Antrodiella citrinella TaxID=2447956 RepID=A0A4V3XIU3_9APHY|nr:hypothetical protein EUX98_g3685 [Antrodiella citrinella]